jgi:hypothetical protein
MPSIGVYYGRTIRNGVQKPLPPGEWYKRAQSRRQEEHAPRD